MMNEIQKTEGEIKVLQAKLELLKEMEKHKSPAEEAYKEIYGIYPVYPSDVSFGYFKTGYIASQKDCKVEEPKVKTLQQIIKECFDDKENIHTIPDIIDTIEKEWTPLNLNQKEKRGYTDGYSMGFDDALNLVRKTLR